MVGYSCGGSLRVTSVALRLSPGTFLTRSLTFLFLIIGLFFGEAFSLWVQAEIYFFDRELRELRGFDVSQEKV